jgi:hypothetical protein
LFLGESLIDNNKGIEERSKVSELISILGLRVLIFLAKDKD